MSSPASELPSVGHLDRANFTVDDQAGRHITAPRNENLPRPLSASRRCDDKPEESSTSPSSFANVRRVSHKVRSKLKTKTHKILPTSQEDHEPEQTQTAPALAPAPATTADDDRLFRSAREHKGLQAKDLLHNPIDTVSSLVRDASGAKVAAVMDNQVIAHGADVNLVRVFDRLASAENREDQHMALDDLGKLKKARQDQYVRWTMDRHVLKVRRIAPCNIQLPQKGDYCTVDENGQGHINWAAYGQHLVQFYARKYGDQYIAESPSTYPATEDAIQVSFERLLMTSTPYQVMLMKIRAVYRWEDRRETAFYLGVYMLLWAIGHITGGAILAIIWFVLRRRFRPPTAEDMRANIKRSEDIGQTATNLTQLIEQHGSRGWVDALIKKLGQKSMQKLDDMADSLEIMRNFYEWRSPDRTFFSLAILTLCWLLVTMTPLWLLVKTGQFGAGLMFFGAFPITSRMPQYRIVLSPLTWLFWKIPTDAEWAIARLQVEARHSKEAMSQRGPERYPYDTEVPHRAGEESAESAIDIGKYHCTSGNHYGALCISSQGVRYVTAVRSTMLWELRYDEMKTMQKQGSTSGLAFQLMDDREVEVKGLKIRDEVFTQIIGYSGLAWQVTR